MSPEKSSFQDGIFSTPSKQRSGILNLSPAELTPNRSPSKSPFKRGIIKLDYNDTILSPIRTPNGRAGLPSPKKRTHADLNKSARKRAMKMNYSKVMDDNGDDADDSDFLSRREKQLAEMIIQSSNGYNDDSDSEDIPMEEDATVPAKRKRKIKKISPSKKPDVSKVVEVKLKSPKKGANLARPKLSEATLEFNTPNITPVSKNIPQVADESPFISSNKNAKRGLFSRLESFDSDEIADEIIPGLVEVDFVPATVPDDTSLELKSRKFNDKALFLDGHEGYFEQHRYKSRISAASMTQAPSLDYQEFITYSTSYKLIQYGERSSLSSSREQNYPQWFFELSQGFSLNFYGIGSKRGTILEFINEYLSDMTTAPILVVNGYNPSVNLRTILAEIIPVLVSRKDISKCPRSPVDMVPFLIKYVQNQRKRVKCVKIVLVVHNIDGESLRDEKTQQLLSQLCSLEEVWFISSIDHINASLLWDSAKSAMYNFIWHDLTTFENYDVELSFKDILNLGKSQKFVGTKGANYVLTSLTSNARNLYKILLTQQLQNMNQEITEERSKTKNKTDKVSYKGTIKHGIEFRSLYDLCLEEFVASNEISFRSMLGEFIEHKMANLVRDASGQEMVFVPFYFQEIKKLIEEELSKYSYIPL